MDKKSCLNCMHFDVCRFCGEHLKAKQGHGLEITRIVFDLGKNCEHYLQSIEDRFEKAVTAATDEINGSLEIAETGNYWFNKYWNLFCENPTYYHEHYFTLKLEKYGENEECIDFEFDTEETKDDTTQEMRAAVERIVKRNMFLLEEV